MEYNSKSSMKSDARASRRFLQKVTHPKGPSSFEVPVKVFTRMRGAGPYVVYRRAS